MSEPISDDRREAFLNALRSYRAQHTQEEMVALLKRVAGTPFASKVRPDMWGKVIAACTATVKQGRMHPARTPAGDTHAALAGLHGRVWQKWNHGWRRPDVS
jgi:hypothetical protein